MKFDRIRWGQAFFKTYYEKRSFGHWLVNFNRICRCLLVLHRLQLPKDLQCRALYICEMVGNCSWQRSSGYYHDRLYNRRVFLYTHHLEQLLPSHRRLLSLIVPLALSAGPTLYMAVVGSRMMNPTVPLILRIIQFFISVTTLIFAIIPSDRVFGDRAAGKPR